MPTIILLKNIIESPKIEEQRDLCVLVKEGQFPVKRIELMRQRINSHIAVNRDTWTHEEILLIAEETVEEFGGTIMPFEQYTVAY